MGGPPSIIFIAYALEDSATQKNQEHLFPNFFRKKDVDKKNENQICIRI